MEFIVDFFLIVGVVSVVFYCFVLFCRLWKFIDFEMGVGGVVVSLVF